ncbi:hypothetical protein BKA93DRAFT_728417 [Sparassis latifolia]
MSLLTVLIPLCLAHDAFAIHRAIGGLDPAIKLAADQCFSNQTEGFPVDVLGYGAGKCPILINCVFDNLSAANQAGLSAGASIAALLPAILALAGAGPVDLIRLSFTSPLRAVATCLFGVGLPSGLFRQLRPSSMEVSHSVSRVDERTQSWIILTPIPTSALFVAKRIGVDLTIVALAGVMLWRNTLVSSVTMVTFRCEYSWLLLCWPMACVLWLILGVVSLRVLAKDVSIEADGRPTNWLSVLCMPYVCEPPAPPVAETRDVEGTDVLAPAGGQTKEDGEWVVDTEGQLVYRLHSAEALPVQEMQTPNSTAGLLSPKPHPSRPASSGTWRSAARRGIHSGDRHRSRLAAVRLCRITVRITMRHATLWGWYEAGLEVVAVGIYLYATFVLGSILFLTGQTSIEYTVLALCYWC